MRQDLDGFFPKVNYTFTDQQDDDETGFYNYRARLRASLPGKFISTGCRTVDGTTRLWILFCQG